MKIISFNELYQLFYLVRLGLASNILKIQRLTNGRMNQNVMTSFRTSKAKPQGLGERECVAEPDVVLRPDDSLQEFAGSHVSVLSNDSGARSPPAFGGRLQRLDRLVTWLPSR